MSESATHDAIEAVVRNSYGRLVAYGLLKLRARFKNR